jgi:hypothetical protein
MKKDRLLITSVDNRSDEEAFDLALRTALEADLQFCDVPAFAASLRFKYNLGASRFEPGEPVAGRIVNREAKGPGRRACSCRVEGSFFSRRGFRVRYRLQERDVHHPLATFVRLQCKSYVNAVDRKYPLNEDFE